MLRRIAAIFSAASALVLLFAGRADAAPATRLVYSRGVGAESCGSEDELRRAVAARLGYDPFFPWARTTLFASIRRERASYHAHIELLDGDGIVRGVRDLEDAHEGCGETLAAMALGISIALDMLDPSRPTPPPPPPPPSPPTPEPPPIPPPAAPTPAPPARPEPAPAAPAPSAAARVEIGADATAGAGALPAPALGADLFGRIRASRASLAVEAAIDAPASKRDRLGTEASAFLVGGAIVPCVHLAALGLCALASVSALEASGPSQASSVLAAVGARVASELPLSRALAFRVHADLVAPLRRVTLRVDGADLWTAPAASMRLGGGLIYRF